MIIRPIPSLLVVRHISPFDFQELCSIHLQKPTLGLLKHLNWIIRTVIRQNGKYQNGCFKKTKLVKYAKKRTFLTPWYAPVYLGIGGKKYLFFGKFEVLCFHETPVLRFALFPYYRQIQIIVDDYFCKIFHHRSLKSPSYTSEIFKYRQYIKYFSINR